MSPKELAKVLDEGGLVIRQKGSSELGITLNAGYLDDLAGRGNNAARKYAAAVEFDVKPGTFDALIGKAAAHPSAAHLFPDLPVFKKGMNVPQVKLEKDGVVSILLGNSPEAVEFFNKQIIRIGTK